MAKTSFTAVEARALVASARSIDGNYLRTETDSIVADIVKAAQQGRREIHTTALDDVIRQRLEHLGYSVLWTKEYSQFEPGYTTISW